MIDVAAIGASAGGLQPLRAIVANLPGDLPAAVLVVVHVAATATSVLPQILQRVTMMEVSRARDGAAVTAGHIIVAPPDRHLIVEDGHVRLSRGPRENGHRPAIDPLLRSLAREYGSSAAAVILSGTRHDGAQGVAELKRCGGHVIVQDPRESEYPDMPANAMAACEVDGVLPAEEIASALVALAGGGHAGHGPSPRRLLELHAEGVERAMWTAGRTLENRGDAIAFLHDASTADGAQTREDLR